MKHSILKFTLICTMTLGTFSCSKKIDEVYKNPNSDVRVPVEEILPQVISAMAGNYAGHGTMNDIRYIGQYVQNWQYYTTLSQFDRMGYINNAADVAQSTWRMHYYDIGQNNMKMIQWALEEKKWDYAGVGKAIFAWSWLTLTDYYGDAILKDAFNTDLITFKFDTQPEIYEHVRQLCFESLELLNRTGDAASPANLAKGDAFFYNGDVNKWKKFVYGILARYHNRFSNKTSYKPDSVIHYAKLAINDNADNAMVKFAATSVSATNNFFGPFRGNISGTTTPTAIRQGAYIANLMNGTSSAFPSIEDPRAIYMLRLNTNNTFRGIQPNKGQAVLTGNERPESFHGVSQAAGANLTNPSNDNNSRYIFRNAAPFPIMTAAEMKFLQAEAEFKRGQKGAARTAYRDAILTNFEMLTTTFNVNIPTGREITAASRDFYVNSVVPANANDLTLSKIMLQKYIALFGHGILETWVDMRRYHYLDIDPSATGTGAAAQVYADFMPPTGTDLFPDNSGKLVYRYQPRFNSEYVWNILELQRIGATSIDYHTKRMWFAEP